MVKKKKKKEEEEEEEEKKNNSRFFDNIFFSQKEGYDARLGFIEESFFVDTSLTPVVVVVVVVVFPGCLMYDFLALDATACCAATSMFLPRGPVTRRAHESEDRKKEKNQDDERHAHERKTHRF